MNNFLLYLIQKINSLLEKNVITYIEKIRKEQNNEEFFRKIIAEDQGNVEKYNYKTNPDITLTLKTVKNLHTFFEYIHLLYNYLLKNL